MLEVTDLTLGYEGKDIISALSLKVERGELLTIAGPNGSGKSTLLRAMAHTLRPRGGRIMLNGRPLAALKSRERARKLAFLPQNHNLAGGFTVRELVGYGRYPHFNWQGREGKRDREVIEWALEVTGLKGMKERFISTLSGGEQQRVWIAMAIAQEADLLLLDEPTTFLDIHHQLEILALIKELNREWKRTVIMVLHDLNQAARFSDRLVVLKDGAIYSEGRPGEVLTEKTLAEVFQISARIIEDDESGAPHFIAGGKV